MIHEELVAALNRQLNQELSAAYNYLGMSAYFDENNLDGFAKWMKLQHDEEVQHAMRLFRYLLDRGGKIAFENIDSPEMNYNSAIEVFRAALGQEHQNTASVNSLYELATRLQDYATKSHLQWFLDEQVEEEKSIEDIIALLGLAEGDTSALLYLNDKLGARSAAVVPNTE